jgi:hypothetical protein
MILISHRGNLNGCNPEIENTADYIDKAIAARYYVEVDVRYVDGGFWLGHDGPQHLVSIDWLIERKKSLMVHAKNSAALCLMLDHKIPVFYHSNENHVVVANTDFIWTHDISDLTEKSIIPLLGLEDIKKFGSLNRNIAGICSDFVEKL